MKRGRAPGVATALERPSGLDDYVRIRTRVVAQADEVRLTHKNPSSRFSFGVESKRMEYLDRCGANTTDETIITLNCPISQ